jgi:hypothetical protein
MKNAQKEDPLAYLEALDAWLEDEDEGTVPMELLEERGMVMPDPASLSEGELAATLTKVIEEMGRFGMYLHYTDHLSDRELYVRLRDDVLRQPTFLLPDDPGVGDHYDCTGSGSDEDVAIHLTYYATDEERQEWQAAVPGPLPAKLPRPYDRDRHLPTMEGRLAQRDGQ